MENYIEIKRKDGGDTVKVFAKTFENEAFAQIKKLANYEPYREAKIRIMPDAHAGKGCTVGTTMTIGDAITPNLVGVDIGCGMLCCELNITKDALTEDILRKIDDVIRQHVPYGFNIHTESWTRFKKLDDLLCWSQADLTRAVRSIGTLGGGNHFIELNVSDTTGKVYLVIHSGSRNLGVQVCKFYQDLAFKNLNNMTDVRKQIADEVIARCKREGRKKDIQKELDAALANVTKPSADKELAHLTGSNMRNYLHDMEIVQEYAVLNRKTMAEIICKKAGLQIKSSFETIHNYIDTKHMILRKGAVSAEKGEMLLIPMNMRDGSLICIGKGNEDWNCSAPHGAGRLMSRGKAKQNISIEEYKESMEGIYTSCVSYSTIDEAPQAYKAMDEIVECIQDTVEIVEHIRPVYNFKASEVAGSLFDEDAE